MVLSDPQYSFNFCSFAWNTKRFVRQSIKKHLQYSAIIYLRELVKLGSVVNVATFNIGLKCQGEILVCGHRTALRGLYSVPHTWSKPKFKCFAWHCQQNWCQKLWCLTDKSSLQHLNEIALPTTQKYGWTQVQCIFKCITGMSRYRLHFHPNGSTKGHASVLKYTAGTCQSCERSMY